MVLRAFALIHAKIHVYFRIRTYFLKQHILDYLLYTTFH